MKDFLGFGLGLRAPHFKTILETKPKVDWFEIMSEDYMILGGNPRYYLEKIRHDYPIVMHGVSMSLGSTDPLDKNYLHQLKALIDWVKPAWVSDHICWSRFNHVQMHDLLPVPYTEEAARHLASRIREVQDFLGRQILVENVSSYVDYKQSEMSEYEFITSVVTQADCLILLDVNNIYVNHYNHGIDPLAFLAGVPADRVQQIHLAGHQNYETHVVDTHDHPIIDPVWDLYTRAVETFGAVSTMIERDDHIPPLEELLIELDQARGISESILNVDKQAIT